MGTAPVIPSSNDKGIFAWLKRPENKTTAIFMGVAAVVLFWFWGIVLPFALAVLDGTLEALYHGILIAVILYLLLGEKPRKFVGEVMKMLERLKKFNWLCAARLHSWSEWIGVDPTTQKRVCSICKFEEKRAK